MVTKTVELLAPAGSPEALAAAAAEGADGVYLGLKSFNARMRSANFSYAQFEGSLRAMRRMGRKVYVTVNTVFEQREGDRVYQLLKYLAGAGPDGIIVQDYGVLMMAREFPGLRIHASTQMNIASARGANGLSKYGVSRVVLARELGVAEIAEIHCRTNLELEVFVHGALCVSESGLCLFSSYLGGKSANRGLCTQACRRLYTAEPSGGSGGENPAPGEPRGAYYFSPCDLSLIARVPDLAEAGVRSFKIEGRMKSAEYVGAVVSAYRLVIDSLDSGGDAGRRALDEARLILRNDFARPKTEFLFIPPEEKGGEAAADWLRPDQAGGTGIALGAILKVRESGGRGRAAGLRQALIRSGVAPVPGDTLRFHRADDSERVSLKLSRPFITIDGPPAVAAGNGSAGPAGQSGTGGLRDRWIPVPGGFEPGDTVYLIRTGGVNKRYPPIMPKDLTPFKRCPGRERAPGAPFDPCPQSEARANKDCPAGIYAAVSSIEDLYVLQAVRPAGVFLTLDRGTLASLLDNPALPFRETELIPSLDPFFPQGEDAFLSEAIPALYQRGFRRFMVNNPGHFSLFSGLRPPGGAGKAGERPVLIAGPYLYAFNAWAAGFVFSRGADFFTSPLENSRQNLEKTLSVYPALHAKTFVTLLAWPALFRIRAALDSLYSFREFRDSRDERFRLTGGAGSSFVIPEKPFSITDKLRYLREAGYRRFILDFSNCAFTPRNTKLPLHKKDYKDIMRAIEEAAPLPNISRFNWKDGFYTVKE
ncbi:MAG: U32 family peptidase [Treponema sp.]|jgi:putative protease|nr:U32 family peptidase [Treponema sp.]